jgi:hypothetical protein
VLFVFLDLIYACPPLSAGSLQTSLIIIAPGRSDKAEKQQNLLELVGMRPFELQKFNEVYIVEGIQFVHKY